MGFGGRKFPCGCQNFPAVFGRFKISLRFLVLRLKSTAGKKPAVFGTVVEIAAEGDDFFEVNAAFGGEKQSRRRCDLSSFLTGPY